jgi:hypothetical protein
MDDERDLVASRRFSSLAEKFHDKSYRDGYVAAHTRGVLARQMRNFRGELSQADYATEIGKQKTVVSRLENPAYSGWSLRTMLEIARKENVAVLIRFVDLPTFLKYTDDLSDSALRPQPYDEVAIDEFVYVEERNDRETALKALFSGEPKQNAGRSAREAMPTPLQDHSIRQRVVLSRSDDTAMASSAANDTISLPEQEGTPQLIERLTEAAN